MDGLEAIFFGPADLSASFGHLGKWEGPGIAEDIIRITNLAKAKNVAAGVIGWDEADMARRADQGFRMIGLGSDVGFMAKAAKALLGKFKGMTYSSRWF